MGRSIEHMVNRQILRWLHERKQAERRWVSESTDAQPIQALETPEYLERGEVPRG